MFEYRAISDDVAEVERIRDLFNAALGERNANVKQDNAKETVTKLNKSNVQYSNKNVVKKTKTRYNEYNTQAMIWSNSNKTKIGDVKIMYKPKVGYTLIECTKQDEGFIELITEKYKEIKRLEQLYSEQITGFNGNVDKFGDFKDGHNWNLQFDSVRKSGKSNSEVSNEQSERNTTNNSEKLHYDNQGKSVKFSVKQPIEETKDLIAIHNTTEEKLLSALELGGLPSPSIAIMKAENTRGNNDFGNISLVFNKSTIDPQADTANKVYSSDAYTPITVRAEHKLNEDKAWDVYSKIRELSKQKLAYNLNPSSFHPDNLKSSIDSAGGINELIDSYKNDYAFKELYLADTAEPR